jgi:hypothetical protein
LKIEKRKIKIIKFVVFRTGGVVMGYKRVNRNKMGELICMNKFQIICKPFRRDITFSRNIIKGEI